MWSAGRLACLNRAVRHRELMSVRSRSLSATLIVAAAALVALGTIYFGSLRKDYSHISNTISELGEVGAPRAHGVAVGFFLPVGLTVWCALWLLCCGGSDRETSQILLALSCLGTGYVVSAFFPCDAGAPLLGSWRTLVHNFAGLVDYGGTAIGFLLIHRRCARAGAPAQSAAFLVAGALSLVCLALLCLQPAFCIRGVIQRVAEIILFAGVFIACLLLSRRVAPMPVSEACAGNRRSARSVGG
jgi:hypothetical protein